VSDYHVERKTSEREKWRNTLIVFVIVVIVLTSPFTLESLFNVPLEKTAEIVIKLGCFYGAVIGARSGYKRGKQWIDKTFPKKD